LIYFPDQLRRIADICEGINAVDGLDAPETNGVTLMLKNGLAIVDEHGDVYGYLGDEIGGLWGFSPGTKNPWERGVQP